MPKKSGPHAPAPMDAAALRTLIGKKRDRLQALENERVDLGKKVGAMLGELVATQQRVDALKEAATDKAITQQEAQRRMSPLQKRLGALRAEGGPLEIRLRRTIPAEQMALQQHLALYLEMLAEVDPQAPEFQTQAPPTTPTEVTVVPAPTPGAAQAPVVPEAGAQ